MLIKQAGALAGFPRLFAERLRKELATGAQLRTFFNLWSSFREMVLHATVGLPDLSRLIEQLNTTICSDL